jgi:hypothetical protein
MWFIAFKCYKLNIFTIVQQMLMQQCAVYLLVGRQSLWSPQTSPFRGRTVKEYENRMSQLQKENFDLKLKIYSLQEQMGCVSRSDEEEDPVKKNINLKVMYVLLL